MYSFMSKNGIPFDILDNVPSGEIVDNRKAVAGAAKSERGEIAMAAPTPLQSHPITLPPRYQPNTYGNPYDINYIPVKDRGPPAPTKALLKATELTQEKLAAAIMTLEAEESGQKVKDEKSFGRKLKRGQKVLHRQGDPTCECFKCMTTIGKPLDAQKQNELANLIYAMLKGLSKRGFDVSPDYAEECLLQYDNKLVHAMGSAVEDLKIREAAIQLSGRVKLAREISYARRGGVKFRDDLLFNIEQDDAHMLEFEELGWKSFYGRAIARQRLSDKDEIFATYQKEAAYRKARAQFFVQRKNELDSGKVTVQEFRHAMNEFDSRHGYERETFLIGSQNRFIPSLFKRKDTATIAKENSEETINTQDTKVDPPVPASAGRPEDVGAPTFSKKEINHNDMKEIEETEEAHDAKETNETKEHDWRTSKTRKLVAPKGDNDLEATAELVFGNGHADLVNALMECKTDEALRHQRLLLLHEKVAGDCYDGADVDEESINHLMEICPYTQTRERAVLEIQIAMGSAAIAVAFSQCREVELDKMHVEMQVNSGEKTERPAYTEAEAMRFAMAAMYRILPKGK